MRLLRALSPGEYHPLKFHIAMLFTVLILIACAAIAASNYVQGRKLLLAAATDLIHRIDRDVGNQLQQLFTPVETAVTLISMAPAITGGAFGARMAALPALVDVLKRHGQIAAIYAGYDNGEFLLVRPLRGAAARKLFDAPPNADFLYQITERREGRLQTRIVLLDYGLAPISESTLPDYAFDARTRPWYLAALKTQSPVTTAPYVYFSTHEVGLTIARKAPNTHAVVGADVTLAAVSDKLQQLRPTRSSELAVLDSDGQHVMAFSDPSRVAARMSAESTPTLVHIRDLSAVLGALAGDMQRYADHGSIEAAGRSWLVKASSPRPRDERSVAFLIATPVDELLAGAMAALERSLVLALLTMLVSVPLVWWISQRIAGNLRALTRQADAIRRFDFSEAPLPRTRIDEVFRLGCAMADMRMTIRKFLDITTALASERNFQRLLERVLKEADEAAGANGGIIYLLEEERRVLRPSAQSWRSGDDTEVGDVALDDEANALARAARASVAAATYRLPAPRSAGLEFVDAHFGREAVTLVNLPLTSRAGEAVGMLCLFVEEGAEPSPERMALVQAFAGAGAAAIDNQRLLNTQKMLLEAVIALVANAIDAKSPYTGGHCQRVPELTKMLARAACEAKSGPFAAFQMDEEAWEALHIAAWLHDCGKVTTPEYVVDKATKLETLYDRIHEIRMRFEVLKRDARIACLEGIVAGGDERLLRAELVESLTRLDEDFAFVAACNHGGEFMSHDRLERLREIASRTWKRTLDDRLGVSHEEAQRMARKPVDVLPAIEFLLADKPQHIMERAPQDVLPMDNRWGFRLERTQHLYNRGELYNLSISRGTLTPEERCKINDHIVQTIVMLTSLPLPKHLKAVPELAGGHHETIDGRGYPKRLRGEEMSVQARIMAIADIFEALTAADRPYKSGKTLSEAIEIMWGMKKNRHIDSDLFDLFLTSGVYRAYAERYLDSRYIDDVDVGCYIGAAAGTAPSPAQA
jgi:HD-GYP domain-containing protein (c-di-GMP phosphodiesterase class II)